jgi:hypothetical protein
MKKKEKKKKDKKVLLRINQKETFDERFLRRIIREE